MMDRREFLKQVAAWSAGAALIPVLKITPLARAQSTEKPLLIVARGKDYARLVELAVEQLGGMGQFVKKGDRVVIKPNIAWDRPPELAATTHPEVVRALVRLALAQEPAQVLVFDRTCNEPRRCYANTGIAAAVASLNDPRATCPFVDDRRFVPVKIDNGKALQQWDIYRDALEADCYINVPIAKHHGLARLTLGMKNVMGVLGGRRGALHTDLAQKLADLNTVIRPRLTVIDATRILLRNGPQGGNPADVKVCDTIIVSTDPVAADAYATTLFGLQPRDIPATVAAYDMGLGQIDLNQVRIVEVAA